MNCPYIIALLPGIARKNAASQSCAEDKQHSKNSSCAEEFEYQAEFGRKLG